MCEHDASDRVKRARAQIVKEQAIVGIDIGRSDRDVCVIPNRGPNAPVERVILPDDSLQAQLICNIANAVLCQQKLQLIYCYDRFDGKMRRAHQHRHREDANMSV